MPSALQLEGQKFARLLVLKPANKNRHGQRRWLCRCDCGTETTVLGYHLKNRNTKSCGCLVIDSAVFHGSPNSLLALRQAALDKSAASIARGWVRIVPGTERPCRLYKVWIGMRERCRDKDQPYYGSRGISVCEAWQDYAVFRAWAVAHGYQRDLTIERDDNDRGYDPNNCRWASMADQNRNHRNTVKIAGEVASTVAKRNGIAGTTFHDRLKRGWTVQKAATTPPALQIHWRKKCQSRPQHS